MSLPGESGRQAVEPVAVQRPLESDAVGNGAAHRGLARSAEDAVVVETRLGACDPAMHEPGKEGSTTLGSRGVGGAADPCADRPAQ